MKFRHGLAAVAAAALLLLGAPAAALDVTPTVTGNELTAQIELPGGLSADLTITFEQAVGLHAGALEISASVVGTSDTGLLSRLPASVSLPAAFPVVVRIEPADSSALSFSGVYRLVLHTHNLPFQALSPLRLYRSASGGPFVDMTGSLEMGSVRAGGSGPGFSEFLIAADLRPTDAVIAQKLATLEQALSANQAAIAPTVYADLSSRAAQLRSQISTGAITQAIDTAKAFGAEVKQQSGAAIPDVWQAHGSLVNVAGTLRAAADTLRYSLVVKANGG